MSTYPTPAGFGSIDEWILHFLFENPKSKQTTYSLFMAFGRAVRPEASSDDGVDKNQEFAAVEYAVETLIQKGRIDGERDSGANGVFFKNLKLTGDGQKEAIRRKRERDIETERKGNGADTKGFEYDPLAFIDRIV